MTKNVTYGCKKWLQRLASAVFLLVLSACAADTTAKINRIKSWIDIELGYDTSQFWGSRVFSDFFDIFNTVYKDGFDVLASASLKLITLGFALWLAFFTMRLVGSLNAPSPADYLNNVFRRGFVVLCFGIFLGNTDLLRWLLNNTVVLVIGAFSGTAIDIMNSVMTKMQETKGTYSGSCTSGTLDVLGSSTGADHLDALRDTFSCVILEMHKQLVFAIGLGKIIKTTAPGIFTKLMGCFAILLFMVIDFMIPIFIMDGLFKFMVAVIMSPVFCAAWVFPATRGFVKKAWNIVMGMGLQILFTVIYICMAVACVRLFAAQNDSLKEIMSNNISVSFNATDFGEMLEQGAMTIFSFLFCGIFMLLMADKMSALANSFTGAPATSIVSDAVKGAMTGAIKLAARLVEAAVTIVASIYTGGAAAAAKEAVKLAIKAAIRAAMMAAQKAANSLKKG